MSTDGILAMAGTGFDLGVAEIEVACAPLAGIEPFRERSLPCTD
jgi:hypothetical protein